jgi:hypothetical protein
MTGEFSILCSKNLVSSYRSFDPALMKPLCDICGHKPGRKQTDDQVNAMNACVSGTTGFVLKTRLLNEM